MTVIEKLVLNGTNILNFLKNFSSATAQDVSVDWVNDDDTVDTKTFANIKKFQDSVGMTNDAGVIKDLDRNVLKAKSNTHTYRIGDIPEAAVGGVLFEYSFTLAQASRVWITASYSLRHHKDTSHNYQKITVDDVYLRGCGFKQEAETHNHSINVSVWVDLTAGEHTVKLINDGSHSTHGAGNGDYDGFLIVEEI
jgi:hypothetical protein